ncbi:MAG: pyridoxamine 5'-phosphate oxidase family protein [Candidatus Omnitrophica bacterium]|nr:pyridoxamine 5'-phosphate oxidase family protein [Candidatus Omnitrophota bacterium]
MIKITPDIKKLIEGNPLAFATTDSIGKPNVIPVAYVKVVSKNQILITDNYMKQTKENLGKNNNVCLAVWDKNWKGYKLVGSAKYFTSGKWKKFVKEMPENKGLPAKGAILVTVSKLIKLR